MEEEEPDYGTPIGKVIKHINTLCKKPKVDEQLSEALDLFKEKLDEQEKYLVNGIFKINFSEAALFLQSSAELYGKKLDLLWDELLEFHTRLIKYDCEHEKEKGGTVDKEVIEKLEERRNRYKRKKKFKLLLQTSNRVDVKTMLFDDKENKGEQEHDYNYCYSKSWRDMEYMASEMRKIPCVVYKHMLQHYLLKNYPVPRSEDYDIIDMEDDEFNTKWSRIPRWNHIWHLFEYNDKGLMPDRNNIIARLRLSEYGRIKFMHSLGLPFGTPFEKCEKEYLVYRKRFLEEEPKKWQNMPLDTLEDLRKQLQYLVQKDLEENGVTATDNDNATPGGGGNTENSPTIIDKIDLLDHSDDDSLFELSFSCDKEFMKSDLFVRLEKLSSDLINTKLRQDSGFFDFNSDSDNECDNMIGADELNSEGIENESGNINEGAGVTNEIRDELNKDNNGEIQNGNENADNITNNDEVTDGVNTGENIENQVDTEEGGLANVAANADSNVDDMDEVRSYISDHDYCLTIPPVLASDNDSNVLTSPVDEENTSVEKESCNKQASKPLFAVPRDIPKAIRIAHKRGKAKADAVKSDDQSPTKRRKLSVKQLEKLLQSKIKPVREQKFEKFFSMNYQSQMGEGEVPLFEYDSGDSDIDDQDDLPEEDAAADISNRDDVQSIMSDHDYCERLTEDAHNDSGFIDTSNTTPENETSPTSLVENLEATTPPIEVEDEATRKKREEKEQYEKLLAELIESGKDNEDNIATWMSTERAKQEQELKAAHARVEEWRNSITPILRNLKENDFDIHEYGSRIMDNMEVKETKPFKEMVKGKPSAEVVRFFISSLQLANTNNIEICGAKQGQLSNDTFGVKLLSRDRYHEHLQEYLAPSEETLREKLDRVRAMMAAEKESESGEPAAKNLKIAIAMKEKRTKNTITVRKTYSKPKSRSSTLPAPLLTVKLNKNTEAQLTKSKTNTSESSIEHVQDENNHSQSVRVLIKGKNIVKRPVMSETSPNTQFHNGNVSMPSTSRQYANPYITYPTDDQMPSTSSAIDISPNRTINDQSPNKRRRDSDEDSFRERLLNVQGIDSGVQMQSTPKGPSPPKQVKTSIQKSILFE